MSDYISREALIGKVEKHYCAPCKGQDGDLGGDWCRFCAINGVLEKVRGIPAADAVPVVRCRDCIHYNGHRHCDYFCEAVLDDDFCSYGKARETPINLAPLSQEERWLKTI